MKKVKIEMKVLLIIPAFNEEESILKTITTVNKFRNNCKYKLDYVVVNDGSTDNTEQILQLHSFNHIQLVTNLGIGGAVQTGYKYAFKNNYDIAIQFDGDGQHDISSLNNLISPILKDNVDMTIGSRFILQKKSEFQTTFMRRLGINVISFCIKLVTGHKILDTTSGFRASNTKVIKYFADRYPTRYPEPESIVHLIKKNFSVIEVPVNMFERQGGESSITPIKSIRYMCEVCLSILVTVLMKKED